MVANLRQMANAFHTLTHCVSFYLSVPVSPFHWVCLSVCLSASQSVHLAALPCLLSSVLHLNFAVNFLSSFCSLCVSLKGHTHPVSGAGRAARSIALATSLTFALRAAIRSDSSGKSARKMATLSEL